MRYPVLSKIVTARLRSTKRGIAMTAPDSKNQNDTLERELGDAEISTSFAADDGRDEKEYLRAPNEDDDGYDPYSDRHDDEPLFERDPWN